MDEPAHHSDLKSEVAKDKPRDENGHFIHVEKTVSESTPHTNPLTQFLHDETAVHKSNNDELIDVHIGNPLRKITTLLEEIKRQKAFSFSIKGSLGIMGLVLVAGTFGILGGSRVLCDKGVQTKAGMIKTLKYQDEYGSTIPFLASFLPKSLRERTVLTTLDNQVIHVILENAPMIGAVTTENVAYYVTGRYDSCSQTLTVDDVNGLQPRY